MNDYQLAFDGKDSSFDDALIYYRGVRLTDFAKPFLAIGEGAELISDDPYNEVCASTMTWICGVAVEQVKPLLPRPISNWRFTARMLHFAGMKDNAFIYGSLATVERLGAQGQIHPELLKYERNAHAELIEMAWRAAAASSGRFLAAIQEALSRKGQRGRPKGSLDLNPPGDVERLKTAQCDAILRRALADLSPSQKYDRSAVERQVRHYTRESLLRGDLLDNFTHRFGSIDSGVDLYCQRIGRMLDAVEAAQKA